ncbi:MAG: mannose-1-phosphate guanylyltransferase [Lachnospiraceae bacterium]|nr:mannose-1-phosphate guanylyltransferase [Lachnospiraceae bacterium]
MNTYGIIMAGGGGTRFWPLSRADKPKQFLNLSGEDTMVRETAVRLGKITGEENLFIVTSAAHRDMSIGYTEGVVDPSHILGEPAARNTAACIGYAAMEIIKKYEDGIMVIAPSDHFIKDEEEFVRVMKEAVKTAEETSALVTVGIKPTFPCTGYGYIRNSETDSDVYRKVDEFVEKPDLETAESYVDSGYYAWNSGMFVWKASVILGYFEKLLPDIYDHLKKIGDAMGTPKEKEIIEEIYPSIPKISIDYGIMERADNVLMLEGDFGWNDVGSFDALEEVYGTDENGNVNMANSLIVDSHDNVFCGPKDKLIAAMGVENIVVVTTEDGAVMVCDKRRVQEIRRFPELLKGTDNEKFI